MIDRDQLHTLRTQLKGIFALKVTRSTFRELQNAIMMVSEGNEETARGLFESLLSGKMKKGLFSDEAKRVMQNLIDEFCIPGRLAKEVAERGEFISIISSDAMQQQDNTFFMNRLRRIDGEEFQFLSDTASMLHLLGHFIDRMTELKRSDKGQELLQQEKETLQKLAERLNELA